MAQHEHYEFTPGIRYLCDALAPSKVHNRRTRIQALEAIYWEAQHMPGQDANLVLADAVSRTIELRMSKRRGNPFQDFVVLVGQQGSGKDTMGREFVRRGYRQVTMSDVVKAVAPGFGFSPDTTQGKIDAGHKIRALFGKGILMNLCVGEARRRRAKKVVVIGPRSIVEVATARHMGARIIGLIADSDSTTDSAIRCHRVTVERLMTEPERKMTDADFRSREKQERGRTKRMLRAADSIVVTNRKAADLVDELIPKATRV